MNRRALSTLMAGLFSTSALVAACSHPSDTSGDGGSGGTGGAFEGSGGSGGSKMSSGGGGESLQFGGHDSGSGGDGRGDGGNCGSVALKPTVVPGNIVVVFDQSSSMGGKFSDVDGGTPEVKWQVAETALVASVQPIQDVLNLGAIFFPTSKCAVLPITMSPQLPIEDGATFLTDFQAHFSDPNWTTIGSTPLADALGDADTALPDPSPLEGQRAVVVITDGAPTCGETDDMVTAPVTSMAARGIKTYAIGLPGSDEAATLLNEIAAAGGTGTYISPSSPMDLQTELAAIASQTIDHCVFTLDPAPVDPAKVYLFVKDADNPDGVEIARSHTDGWTLASDGVTATLHGSVCQNAKDGVYSDVIFVYGCPVIPK